MTGFDTHGMEQLLARTRGVLDSMRRDRAGNRPDPSAWQVGEALDGQIQAAAADGRLAALRLAPAVLRRSADDLAAHVVVAVNQALAGAAPAELSTVDSEVLAHRLRDLQEHSVRQMREFGLAMDDILARMRAARR